MAHKYLHEALALGQEIESKPIIFMTLIRLAQLDIERERFPRAVKILSFVFSEREKSSWAEDRTTQLLADLEIKLTKNVFEESFQSGTSFELNALVNELMIDKFR